MSQSTGGRVLMGGSHHKEAELLECHPRWSETPRHKGFFLNPLDPMQSEEGVNISYSVTPDLFKAGRSPRGSGEECTQQSGPLNSIYAANALMTTK